jgi:hypothetical protein
LSGGDPKAAELVIGAGRIAMRQRVAPSARVQFDHRHAEISAEFQHLAARLDDIETRIPARLSSDTKGVLPTTSRPPSVVRSARFSGTRQQACGRIYATLRHDTNLN